MPIAYNEQTGEALYLTNDGQWAPARIAENPKTGERLAFDGKDWQAVAARKDPQFGDNGATWGAADSFGTGVLQGLGDELKAAAAATKESLSGGLPFGKAYDQALSMYRGARDQYRQENPVASTAAELGGGLTTGLLTAPALPAAAPTLAGRVAQGGALGMAQGGVYGFNEGEGGAMERAKSAGASALMGGAIGAAAPAIITGAARVVTPGASTLSPEMERLAQVAKTEGIPLTPGQQTGNKPMQVTESVFRNLPMTAGPQGAIQDAQRKAFNRAVLARAGVNADNASPEVLRDAFSSLGGKFSALAGRNAVTLDQQFLDDLASIRQSVARDLTPDQASVVNNYIDDLVGGGGGRGMAQPQTAQQVARVEMTPSGPVTIVEDVAVPVELSGQDYQKWRSAMTRRARNAGEDQALRGILKDLRNSLDAAATRSISPEDAAAWDAVRRQYANLKTIEGAMNNRAAGTIGGDIQGGALIGAVSKSARQGGGSYARGGASDLNDLARVGGAFIRDNIPDSGTAQRMLIQNMLTGGVAGGAGYLSSGDPVNGLLAFGAGMAGPRVVQMAYNSAPVRNYLTNQVAANLPRNALLLALQRAGAGYGGASAAQGQRP